MYKKIQIHSSGFSLAEKNRFSWAGVLIFLLFLFGTLFKADTAEGAGFLPESFQPVFSIARWTMLLLIGTLGCFFVRNACLLNVQVWLYFIFYAFLALWSINGGDFLRFFSMSIFVISVPLFFKKNVRTISYLRNVLRLILFCAVILIILSLAFNAGWYSYRFPGPFANPNTYSMANLFFISIAVTLFFLTPLNSRFERGLLVGMCVFLVVMQVATGSKAGAAGLFAMIGFFFLGNGIRLKTLLVIGVSAAIVFGIANMFAAQALDRFTTFSDATESGRDAIWEKTIDCIRREPMSGYGTSTEAKIIHVGTDHIHSFYLSLFFFTGIPVGAIISTLYLTAASFAFFVRKKILQKQIRSAFLASSSFLVGFALQAVGEEAPSGVGNPIFVYFLLTLGITSSLLSMAPLLCRYGNNKCAWAEMREK
ncbi:MAG: O-antigen ligase family protein [Opitutales bacterium]|nr:O-antigen ligase family protein [Opitutales bacterium]